MRLRHKKACGLDGIYAENITNCSRRLYTIMAMCLSGFFVHGFLPDAISPSYCIPQCVRLIAGERTTTHV